MPEDLMVIITFIEDPQHEQNQDPKQERFGRKGYAHAKIDIPDIDRKRGQKNDQQQELIECVNIKQGDDQ